MAAVTAPARTAAQHQSLLHFVGQASWSDEKVLAKVYATVRPAMERDGPIEAWIIDDTGCAFSIGAGGCQALSDFSIDPVLISVAGSALLFGIGTEALP
jgi:hypothetical protein